jgi:hypothetical protein
MAIVAALCCVPALLAGAPDLVLVFSPALLVFGLLVCGRYIGEERIVARRCGASPAIPRRAPRRLPRPASERPLASLLARHPRLERGPPAGLALTA